MIISILSTRPEEKGDEIYLSGKAEAVLETSETASAAASTSAHSCKGRALRVSTFSNTVTQIYTAIAETCVLQCSQAWLYRLLTR